MENTIFLCLSENKFIYLSFILSKLLLFMESRLGTNFVKCRLNEYLTPVVTLAHEAHEVI